MPEHNTKHKWRIAVLANIKDDNFPFHLTYHPTPMGILIVLKRFA